jgi:hypothetical protein
MSAGREAALLRAGLRRGGRCGFNNNVVPALLLNRPFPQQRRLPAVARAAAPGLRGC